MTVQEAQIFLKLKENCSAFTEDDLRDSKESFLFEHKSFFLSKAPIQKMFDSRLKKMCILKTALDVLKLDFKYDFEQKEITFENGDSILQTFQNYNAIKQKLKISILNSENPLEIKYLVCQLIKLEKDYAKNWFLENCWDETILVSKELDPMEILKAIKEYEISAAKTFIDLKNNRNNPPELLISEMKRLSLLFKKY